MISSTTPDKLAEIIRDTWPGRYRQQKRTYNKDTTEELKNDKSSGEF